MEQKTVNLELKDFDTNKRTAVIAHAVYNNIDRTDDISCKGMFDKTWQENKSIDFLFNHDRKQVPGHVLRVFDDAEKAYTEVKFGNWTLGNDVMEMAFAGVLKGASFGYVAEKKEYTTIKGKKIRKLKEVFHSETSLLTVTPANPLAGIVSLTKDADFDNAISEMKEHIRTMENFCRNTNASDGCIKTILEDINSFKSFLLEYDTAATHIEPDASISLNVKSAIQIFLNN